MQLWLAGQGTGGPSLPPGPLKGAGRYPHSAGPQLFFAVACVTNITDRVPAFDV